MLDLFPKQISPDESSINTKLGRETAVTHDSNDGVSIGFQPFDTFLIVCYGFLLGYELVPQNISNDGVFHDYYAEVPAPIGRIHQQYNTTCRLVRQ